MNNPKKRGLPPLTINLQAIKEIEPGLKRMKKHAYDAEKWSKKQEASANAECVKLTAQGKALPVHSPCITWRKSPTQLTQNELGKQRSPTNDIGFINAELAGLTVGGRRKTRKTRKTKKQMKKRKSAKKTRRNV